MSNIIRKMDEKCGYTLSDKEMFAVYAFRELGKTSAEIEEFLGMSSSKVIDAINKYESTYPPENTIINLRVNFKFRTILMREGFKTLEDVANAIKNDPDYWCVRFVGFGKVGKEQVEERLKFLGMI